MPKRKRIELVDEPHDDVELEVPEKKPKLDEEVFPELHTTNGRRARNKAVYIQWVLGNPGKCKFGSRDQVYNGDSFCTRGELIKADLFMQDGRVKSRALSSAMVSRHREIKLAEHGLVEEKDN